MNVVSSRAASHPSAPSILFPSHLSQFLYPPVCIHTGGCLSLGAAPCTWFHEVPVDLVLEFVLVSLDGILSPWYVTCTTQLGSCSPTC